LALGWKNLAAYPPGHPTLGHSLEQIEQRLNELRGPAPELIFGVAVDGLLYGQEKIDSMYAQKFAYALYSRGVALLRFETPSVGDIETFLRLLGSGQSADQRPPLWEELTGQAIMTIHLQPVDYSAVQVTDSLEEVPQQKEADSLWETILRALLAGREMTPQAQQVLSRGVKSVDELTALILKYSEGHPDTEFDPNATFGVRFTARVPDPSQTREAVVKRVNDAISLYIGGVTGLKKQLATQQVTQLLKSLPSSVAAVITRGVMRALASDETAGALMREFVSQIQPDTALDSLRYLSTVSKLSSHAMTLLQSLSIIDKPPGEQAPLPDSVLSDLVDLFGEDDPDRFNPPDHRDLLTEVAVNIPNLSPRMMSNIEALGNRVETVRDVEIDRLLSRTLLELLTSLGTTRDATPILKRLETLFLSYLANGEFEDALEVFERLQDLAISTETAALRAALDATFAELASVQTTEALIESLLSAAPEQSPAIQKLIEVMGSAATHGLLVALSEESNMSRRRKLFDVVASLGPVVVPEVKRFLADPRWFVVRNMIALLRAVNDRSGMIEVRKLAQHRDLRVRLEAIKTLLTSDSSLPITLLDDAINDPDPKLAETAITLVGNYGIKEGVAPLLRILSGSDVFRARTTLRIRAIKALGELAVPTALPEMSRFFKDSMLPWPAREERRAAYESLAGYPGDARAHLIERGLRSRDPEVRDVCRKLTAR
jgi:hypothetical protein